MYPWSLASELWWARVRTMSDERTSLPELRRLLDSSADRDDSMERLSRLSDELEPWVRTPPEDDQTCREVGALLGEVTRFVIDADLYQRPDHYVLYDSWLSHHLVLTFLEQLARVAPELKAGRLAPLYSFHRSRTNKTARAPCVSAPRKRTPAAPVPAPPTAQRAVALHKLTNEESFRLAREAEGMEDVGELDLGSPWLDNAISFDAVEALARSPRFPALARIKVVKHYEYVGEWLSAETSRITREDGRVVEYVAQYFRHP